jgi:hypothetical protein
MFYMTAQSVIDAVVLAKANGIDVRMVIDASGRTCCSNDLNPRLDQLCDAGIPMKTEDWGAKNHNKWAVADSAVAGKGIVIEGSTNWSAAGFNKNDENILVIRNDTVAGHFTTDFNNKYNDISAPACTFVAVEGNTSSTCTNGNCNTACTSGSCCDSTDNDYDGYTDAGDFGCYDGAPPLDETVANYGAGSCSDGIDNDGDNFMDANDYDCWPDLGLEYENTLAKCQDNIDNDGDGFADGADFDCVVPLGGSPEQDTAACTDGIDNDNDGYTDANDFQCCNAPDFGVLAESACEITEASCTDSIDNDGDGFTDCADFGCSGVPSCLSGGGSENDTATCSDSVDNDGDGAVDGDDSDCAGVTGLSTEAGSATCSDGVDNDGDKVKVMGRWTGIDETDADCDGGGAGAPTDGESGGQGGGKKGGKK